MELSLRKARKIESSLVNFLSDELSLDSKGSVRSLGSLEQANESLSQKKAELLSNLDSRVKLLELIYKIRRLIEIKNEEVGINSLINTKVFNQKVLEDIQKIDRSEKPSVEELQDMLQASSKLLNSGNDSDNFLRRSLNTIKTSFSVSCLDKNDLEFLSLKKATILKDQQKIDEDINYLNITKTISLNEEDIKMLEMCKLL